VLALALAAGSATWVEAEAVTFHGLEFPDQVAGAERTSIQEYEKRKAGLGYSAGYRRGEMVATVYIYDLGQTNIPTELDAPPLRQQLEQARYELVQVQQQRGPLQARGEFRISDSRNEPRLACAAYVHFRHEGGDHATFACVGSAKGKYLKLRITMPQKLGAADEAIDFLHVWVDRLWPPA
jgi:hypothetical protein